MITYTIPVGTIVWGLAKVLNHGQLRWVVESIISQREVTYTSSERLSPEVRNSLYTAIVQILGQIQESAIAYEGFSLPFNAGTPWGWVVAHHKNITVTNSPEEIHPDSLYAQGGP